MDPLIETIVAHRLSMIRAPAGPSSVSALRGDPRELGRHPAAVGVEALAISPGVPLGGSFRYSITRPSTSRLSSRAAARRLLARRAVARRDERGSDPGQQERRFE